MADKQLDATTAASAFQKQWFADLRRRVFDERQPYALVQADVPFELFDLLDIPAVSNQWWAAIVAAKRQAPAVSRRDGCRRPSRWPVPLLQPGLRVDAVSRAQRAHPGAVCRHRACSVRGSPATASIASSPCGPKPSAPSCSRSIIRAPASCRRRWWELGRHRWRELVEPHRLAFIVATLESTGRAARSDQWTAVRPEALRERLELVNQQEEVFDDVRRLIAAAPECPVRMTEQITNVMATQWVRGSEWAIAHARAFRDEVKQRVDAGVAACPGERARLMWVGAGLWHDTGFYTAFEASHRAVFVWSMYLAFGPDGYIRYGLDDPMAALASRTASFNEYLHNPPWAAEWIVAPGARAPDRRCAGPSTAAHEARGHGPPVHRACARGRGDSGAADRGRCRRCAGMGC